MLVSTPRLPLLLRFAPHVAELPVARRNLRDWLTAGPHNDEAVQELLVVATELCTNAVRHAGAGLVTLRAWEEPETIVVEVEGLERADISSSVVRPMGETLDEGGRGMLIVERLCDELSVVVRGRSRFVRCRKRLMASV